MSAIDFSDDPRAVLIHFNEKHDRLGRFAKKSGGSTTKSISPYGNYEIPDGGYHNPMDDEIANSGGKDGLLTPRLKAMEETYKMFKRIYNGGSGSFTDVINKSIDAYIKPESIRDSSYLRSKIANDRYHPPEDFLTAAAAVSDFIWRDMLTGYRQFLADEEIEYKLEEGSIDNKEAWDEFAATLEEKGLKKMIVQEVGKRFGELYENQSHHGYDKIEDQAREKETSGSAKIKKRATNAEQAYKMMSDQRNRDIKSKSPESASAKASNAQNTKSPRATITDDQRIQLAYKNASEASAKGSPKASFTKFDVLKNKFKKLKHVDYTDDPRAVLIHRGGGNPYHDPKTGQFTTATGLGIGKYIDSEGNLTEEGKRRLAHDKKRNAQKKKDDQVKAKDGMTVDQILTDPHRWVKEDLNEIESGLKAAGALTGDVSKFLKSRESNRPLVRKKRLKLKDMTDAELQAQINRYLLEQRYEDIFNPKEPPEVSKGKKFLMNTLEVTGGILAVGASAVTIAKALHELKKGS